MPTKRARVPYPDLIWRCHLTRGRIGRRNVVITPVSQGDQDIGIVLGRHRTVLQRDLVLRVVEPIGLSAGVDPVGVGRCCRSVIIGHGHDVPASGTFQPKVVNP